MPIPDYQSIMLPLLKFLGDKKIYSIREAISYISDLFNLTQEEREEPLPSGNQAIIDNRTGWARTYLKKADLVEDPKRGYVKITDRGLSVLEKQPRKINIDFLMQFPEFVEFRKGRGEKIKEMDKDLEINNLEGVTPDELIEKGYGIIRNDLEQELLDKIRKNPPNFFESLVLNLLSHMGYGEGEVTGCSGDQGIDGIINEDKLGLGKIFLQAKRFNENTTVSSSMIRDFLGALESKGIHKGVFITTSKFSNDAEDIIKGSHKSIVLIDGRKLVQLMIENNLGVNTETTYEIKNIDSDFFPEE